MPDEPVAVEPQEPVAKTFASHIGEDGTLSDGWKETIPEEYRAEKCLDLFNNVDGIFKTLVHGQKSFGKDKVVVPGENALQEDVDAFQKAWGRPETVDDYTFNRDEAIPEEVWDSTVIDKFKAGAHEKGFNATQMAFVEEFYNDFVKAGLAAESQAEQAALDEANKALDDLWGDARKEREHLANRVIHDTTEEGPVRDAILDAFGNYPRVIEWIADTIGVKLVESKAVDTTIHIQTPKELEAEIADLQSTEGYMNGKLKQTNPTKYKQVHEKITSLHEQAFKSR